MVARLKDDYDGRVSSSSLRKVKSGCHTCKRRKVKCDEGWPVCNRCQSVGRHCDGYGIWGGGSHATGSHSTCPSDKSTVSSTHSSPNSTQPSPSKSMRLITLQRDDEKQCFEWFVHRSSKKLPGVFRSDSWTTILFQASTTEPAIKHAVLALGSAHKEEVRGIGYRRQENEDEDDEQMLFTTLQYSKAIRSLQPYLTQGGGESMRITLISCALFVWMEYLRGHYQNSILHLEYGLRLLVQSNVGAKGQDPWSTCVDGWIITIFTRILVQAKLLGQASKLACQNLFGLDLGLRYDRFSSIHHARRSLEHITLLVMDTSQQSEWLEAEGDDRLTMVGLLGYRDKMRHALEIWNKTFETTLNTLGEDVSPMDSFAYRILRLYYYMACVIVGTCSGALGELEFDRYESTFLKIIIHSIETHKMVFRNGEHINKSHSDPEPTSPNSTLDLGWVAPLYYTATKCRNHRIRYQAIRFMDSSSHREGIWSSPLAAALARKIMQIEEESFFDASKTDGYEILDVPTEQDLMQASLPVDFRINKIDISLPVDRLGTLTLQCRRTRYNGRDEWIGQKYDVRSHRWVDRL